MWIGESLPEDLQAMDAHKVMVGIDVVNLYPCLEMDKVTQIIYEGVMRSKVRFTDVDYLECVRYIALNSTQGECEASELRDFLPKRRRKGGARPTVKGAGPRGKVRGDTEQWIFPHVGEMSEVEPGSADPGRGLLVFVDQAVSGR